jgi:hypothetical protein
MAFALVMADKQWGGYSGDANALIGAILASEVDGSNNLRPDDSGSTQDSNPSYFAPAYYKVFAAYTGQIALEPGGRRGLHDAEQVRETRPRVWSPDWCNLGGGAARSSRYYYDATRTRVPDRAGRVLEQRAAARQLPGEGRRLLQRPRTDAASRTATTSTEPTRDRTRGSWSFEGPAATRDARRQGTYAQLHAAALHARRA